ncbi:hypothetical protein HYV88_01915 [Candidatus Woesearchaeota archaeon]|nr:hypothetical protein [Candidatus Woesearchaeota archaeon]
MVDLSLVKERILSIVKSEGPVLPVQISRKLDKDTIFAGAVLSELVNNKLIFISSAKIGGSPVYYVSGQESKLSILYGYLPGKEKEAYELLRTRQILKDSECEPGIRVALRSIRDFAKPLDINNEVYWRWYLINEEEALTLLGKSLKSQKDLLERPKIEKPAISDKVEIKKKEFVDNREDLFFKIINSYFKIKNIELLNINNTRKNREVEGNVRVKSELGILDFYFIAKNKKKINEADLSLANDKGRKHKMHILFLTNGELSKKTQKYLEDNLKGSVIVRRI